MKILIILTITVCAVFAHEERQTDITQFIHDNVIQPAKMNFLTTFFSNLFGKRSTGNVHDFNQFMDNYKSFIVKALKHQWTPETAIQFKHYQNQLSNFADELDDTRFNHPIKKFMNKFSDKMKTLITNHKSWPKDKIKEWIASMKKDVDMNL
ncbi:hypothetical protein SNEBB_010897 [Seison nebaliae]|nr:hypothetical protein SNEBB_010897 [Seison nebaliae]